MFHQDGEQAVQILEIGRIELVDVAVGQVLEADVESFVGAAVTRAPRLHVRLDAHQEYGVEALGLPIGGIDAALLVRGAPGQAPGGVAGQDRRPPVGVHQAAFARRHAPEAVAVEAISGVWPRRTGDRSRSPGEAGIDRRTEAAPRPAPFSQGRGKAKLPGAAAVPEGRAAQRHAAVMGKIGPHLDVGVAVGVVLLGSQRDLDFPPGCATTFS